MPGLTLYMGVG